MRSRPLRLVVVIELHRSPWHEFRPASSRSPRALGARRHPGRPRSRCVVARPGTLEQGRAALADPGRADHGARSPELPRVPHVQHDQIEHVLAQPVQPPRTADRRNPDPLRQISVARVVGAVRGAADVALMRAVDRPERQLRHHRTPARTRSGRQVVAAVIGSLSRNTSPGRRRRESSHALPAAHGSAPTWIGTCSAWAIRRPSASRQRGRGNRGSS